MASHTPDYVLEHFSAGPQDGIFTDGGCSPNPGPGGWGWVWVAKGRIIKQGYGHSPDTTNNRMEYAALIEALKAYDQKEPITVYSDSNLVVKSMNEWAHGWEKKRWTKKGGPIKNLDLVQNAFQRLRDMPYISLSWIKAHNGYKWNEYADSLATIWTRQPIN